MSTMGNIVWVIDDSKATVEYVSIALSEGGHVVRSFDSADAALEALYEIQPRIIISDIMMPGLDGVEFLERVHEVDKELPVILMTANPDMRIALRAIRFRAFDFIQKPIDNALLLHTVKRALDTREMLDEQRSYLRMMESVYMRNTRELRDAYKVQRESTIQTIHVLTKAAEYRDDDTGTHNLRLSNYSVTMAGLLSMTNAFRDDLQHASPMHDIGKIGIPDAILTKPSPLNKEEFEIIKQHTIIGSRILKEGNCPMLRMAEEIARCHHERYDGGGYPSGICGRDIPMSARIVALADQYDALRSSRPYKPDLSHREVCRIILKGDGRTMPEHYDPDVLLAFEKNHALFDDIFMSLTAFA